MGLNHDEIVRQVDAILDSHPNAIVRIVAQKLQVTSQAIEEALNKVQETTYLEFQSNKKLARAFGQLGEISPATDGPYEMVRVRRRFMVPKTTVRYRLSGFWQRKSEFSNQFPLVDISCSGLAFLADQLVNPKKRISLVLKFPGEEALQFHGRVVYAIATGIIGYRYRIGVELFPFTNKRGCNTLKSLDFLARLEKIHSQ
jgi:hypothetical protein